jgi:DNA-binding CsgD family transcriptional regulator
MPTPAELRAAAPRLLVTPFELLRIAEGNPMIVRTEDGGEILLALPTADEMVEQVRLAGERLVADGQPPGPGITRERAAQLVRPVSVDGVVAQLRQAQEEAAELRAELDRQTARARRREIELNTVNAAVTRAIAELRSTRQA